MSKRTEWRPELSPFHNQYPVAAEMSLETPPYSPEIDPVLSALVNTQLVREAGTDALSRPIFVFYACFLPDPSVASYDDLLKALLVRFDALVSNDYVVVVFASGSRHRPKMTWLFRVYRQLERKFRKNLKKLYVVHPSPWFHLLMQVFGPIVSPKFTAKLAWIENMQVLAEYIPIMQVHVPRIIAEIDKQRITEFRKTDAKGASPANASLINSLATWALSVAGLSVSPTNSSQSLFASSTTQFGVPLETLMGPQGARGLPRVVTDCIRFILANGLVTEGLFRVSPSLPSVMSLKELYNSGATEIQMDDYGGVHSACGLLKLFFRELPTPMFESNLYDTIRKIQSFNDTTEPTQLTYLKTILLPILAIPSYILLRALFQLLNQIHANEATTRMHSGNLAIVWAPNLCRSANPVVDLGMCAVGANGGGIGTLVKICVERWEDVFGDQAGTSEELREEEPKPVIIQSDGDLLELGDMPEMERGGRKASRSSDHLARGRPSSVDGVIVAAMKSGAPIPRSRSRVSSERNRHTVVAGEHSALAIAGEALSHHALADASSKGAGDRLFAGQN